MALKPCRECGKEVSTGAKTCPHCGVTNPTKTKEGCGPGCITILILTLAAGVLYAVLVTPDSPTPEATAPTGASSELSSDIPQEHRTAIDSWLTSWSERQAASVRETCEAEPECDPSQYLPSARPSTSFGWDGASSIEPTADWAEGPRYHVSANGRRLLIYLDQSDEVVNATLMQEDGRRLLCRNEAC